jgi:LysM repeat protein
MLWASFIGKKRKVSNTYKTEKGAIMNEGTRNQLEVKLTKMLNHLDQAKAKQKQPIPQPGNGNIIRRRAGEKEKRFYISYCVPWRRDNEA